MNCLSESGEDYLEAVLILTKRIGMVRSIDIAMYMGYSKPSICIAISKLQNCGLLLKDVDCNVLLTETGREIAKHVYEKHCFFKQLLVEVGVTPEKAEKEACRIEHAISDESFNALKEKRKRESMISDIVS